MDLFRSFQREGPAPAALCEKYASALPPELLNVWRDYGFGTLLDGCLKIINPDEYQDLLRDTYALGDSAIPVFATAFAGLLTWEKGRYLRFVNYQSGTFEGVCAGLKFFWGDLADGVFNDRFLELAQYREAVQTLGPLGFDECFGYAPLLALGGRRDARHLRKYKLREHIAFIAQAAGRVSKPYSGSGIV